MAYRFLFAFAFIANLFAATKVATPLAAKEHLDIYVNRDVDEFNSYLENEDRLVLLIMNNV